VSRKRLASASTWRGDLGGAGQGQRQRGGGGVGGVEGSVLEQPGELLEVERDADQVAPREVELGVVELPPGELTLVWRPAVR
jgi:hypothetical protein